jgi:hypothetical protein
MITAADIFSSPATWCAPTIIYVFILAAAIALIAFSRLPTRAKSSAIVMNIVVGAIIFVVLQSLCMTNELLAWLLILLGILFHWFSIRM